MNSAESKTVESKTVESKADALKSILIRNCSAILTGARGAAARHAGPDVRLRGARIDAIGALDPLPGEDTLDGTDCVLYPAWVNTHHHLFQSLLKGDPAGIDLSLTPWLATTPYRFRARIDARLLRLAARIGLVELIRSGCGTVADHHYLYYPGMDFDASAILFDEAERLGVRLVLCRGGATMTRALEADLPGALRPERGADFLRDLERLAADFHDPGVAAMRRVVAAPTTPLFSMAPGELREVAAHARRLGLRLHSHLSETVTYQEASMAQHGCAPVEFCASHDWIGPDVWFAHLVKLEPHELRLLGDSATGMAHCPQSNGRLASGIAPVRDFEDAGGVVSLGVDGAASNEAADMISEAHAAWLMARARQGEATRPVYPGHGATSGSAAQSGNRDQSGNRAQSGETGAGAATVEDVVRWGTSGGAAVLGLGGAGGIGLIAPGMAADLALYALDDPRYFGLHDPGLGPVISAGRPRLKALFVGGRRLVSDDRIEGIDVAELGAEARQAVRALLR